MSKKFKLWTGVGILVVVALVVGLVSSAAFADSPQKGDGTFENRWGAGLHQGRNFEGPGVIRCGEAVCDLLGLSSEEIKEQRLEGMSLVEIAAAQGVDEQTLTDTVLAEAEEALQQNVSDGVITQEQADAILERMQENISDRLNSTDFGPRRIRHCGLGPLGMGAWGDAVSELLGLSPEEIREQRLEGMSLVEIAAAQGVDEQTLTDTVLAGAEETLQQRVNAQMQRFQENVSGILNNTEVGPFGGKPGIGTGNPGQGFGPNHMGQFGPRGGCGNGLR
ncbi:MAG: hypothetical protein SVO26_01165 [Chloroflexota bacterium]|nr:hypothetical protein [Chloroflexota bacterium]